MIKFLNVTLKNRKAQKGGNRREENNLKRRFFLYISTACLAMKEICHLIPLRNSENLPNGLLLTVLLNALGKVEGIYLTTIQENHRLKMESLSESPRPQI